MEKANEGTESGGDQSVEEPVASCSAKTLPLDKRTRKTKAKIDIEEAVTQTKKNGADEFRWLVPVIPRLRINTGKSLEVLECEFCTRVFFSNKELEEHMKIRHNNKKYTCNVCGKGFVFKSYLPLHMLIDEYPFPFKCASCTKACRTRCNLAAHMRTHNSEKPFKCDKCSATFRRKRTMQVHQLRRHTNEKSYEYLVKCGRKFATLQDQRWHAKIHSNDLQKYVCAYCKVEWLRKGHLRRHIFLRHVTESPPECLFACDTIVSESVAQSTAGGFSTLSPIIPASEITVEKSLEELKCEFCTIICFSKKELKKHKKIRHPHKLCKCPVCGKVISTKWYLKEHIVRKHEGKFSFTCKVCPKKFKTQTDLLRHSMRIHSDRKPFRCGKRPATVSMSESLQQHHRLTHIKCEELEPVKIKKEEAPSHGLKPIEEVKLETMKCTPEPVGVNEEQKTIECIMESDEIKMEVEETEQSVSK